jgi:deoxyribodipyrimidine photolyase-related protein
VLVLGDQLSLSLSALAASDAAHTRVLMCEVMAEAGHVPHHRKKISFLFSAMRHFAAHLAEQGWQVTYVRLDDPANRGSLEEEVARFLEDTPCRQMILTEPGEWRLRENMQGWQARFGIPVEILEDTRFLCSHARFDAWAEGRRQLRMEYFYREMRRHTGLLMDGDQPAGGRWNFDAENRKPATVDAVFVQPLRFPPDPVTQEVIALVEARFPHHMGAGTPFWFGVTAEQASEAFQSFLQHGMAGFGDTQDAMLSNARFLNHAVISHYLNAGLLDPLEVCRAAEQAWRDGLAPLNAVEGFIRQIIGWREYVRGIYWREMPAYAERNFFGATRPLPDFYWTGETSMACLRAAITQTIDEAYAHHIQRLMVTGTFALLAGISPQALHEWYLAVYADAYEWVELPNTLGMSQFADGGLLASKPYAASGAYINRMSDYCKGCHYKVSEKTGPKACPFNALYWDFLARHVDKLRGNPRMAQMYRVWERFSPEVQTAYRASAEAFLQDLA